MNNKKPNPGVSRKDRHCDEGLQRLNNHLSNGARMNPAILKQWIKRYGDSARDLIKQHNQYTSELD